MHSYESTFCDRLEHLSTGHYHHLKTVSLRLIYHIGIKGECRSNFYFLQNCIHLFNCLFHFLLFKAIFFLLCYLFTINSLFFTHLGRKKHNYSMQSVTQCIQGKLVLRHSYTSIIFFKLLSIWD